MAPSSGMTRLQYMLNHPHSQTPQPGAPPPTTRSQSLVDVGRSLKQLVQDEWARSSHTRDEDPLLPPLRPHTGSAQRSSSVPSRRLIPPVFAGPKPAYLPPSPPLSPETPQMGFAPPPGLPPSSAQEKERGSAIEAEDEEAAVRVAMQASLRDAPQPTPPAARDELEEALAASKAEEDARQRRVSAQEQSDLDAALLASSQSQDTHSASTTSRSPYLPRLSLESDPSSPPSFLPTDSHPSSYPPEKSLSFPQGRPSLPPGAAAAWDDESREMEMLALAIRMSEEEERERRRLEEREVEEVVRRIEGESAGGSTDEEGSATEPEGRKKGQRRSWVQPPLASSLSKTSSPPLSPTVPAKALPPRPAVPQETMSTATMASYRTAPEVPFNNLVRMNLAESQASATVVAHPPPPRRAPPPPPPAPQRLRPTPPDTPQVAQSATLPAPPVVPPRPYPPPETSSASSHHLSVSTDSTRDSGSPLEMPYLSPSSSLRSSNRAERELRPAIAGFFDDVVESQGKERERRVSGSAGLSSASRSLDEEEEGLTSALSVRNPDSRHSTLSSATSTSSSSTTSSSVAPDPTWEPSDLPVFPSASMGISAYANRSMSAIDEATEPGSSIGGGGGGGEESRQGSFPSTVSVEPVEGVRGEGEWLRGLEGEGEQALESPEPTADVVLDKPTTPVAPPPRSAGSATPIPPIIHADGMRFGYPADCARQLGHVCPHDGLSNQGAVPETIELAVSTSPTGEKRDSWAIEAQSWVALLRSLMWYGDTTVVASSADIAASTTARCAANASLEFRPDDEGLPFVRLVLSLVPPHELTVRLAAHRELSVHKANLGDSSTKGKDKARASTTAPQMTFRLPDVLHLPTRLSSLAIQLYSLRHLASIARATQPAKSPPPPSLGSSGEVEGYAALRELADVIALLAKAAHDRHASASASSSGGGTQTSAPHTPSPFAGTSAAAAAAGAGQPPTLGRATREDQAERLIDRLRDRLRRLKRGSPAPTRSAPTSVDGSFADYDDEHARPSFTSRFSSNQHGSMGADGRTRLVKPPPPSKVTQVPRSERVLIAQANDEVARAPPPESEQDVAATSRVEPERPPLPPRDLRRNEQAARARSGSVPTEMRYMPVLGAR
ncbi:ubiquitin interacting motif protein [Rhodotorula toruloides]|uniref:Ubiquitin interacting motif protein n=1 Tax=Rhodotorula toruloides TaxID=5286 RepID=A0A511K8J0_RHOTO|nr:ubiquitin interacting motif protein [Rhodotorula toruloides]